MTNLDKFNVLCKWLVGHKPRAFLEKKMCKELEETLKKYPKLLFNVSGGCGIDRSLGEKPCMQSYGIWFEFCPFCGRKIEKEYHKKEGYWSWKEK